MSAFLLKDPDCVFIHIPKCAGTSIRKGVWSERYDGPYFGSMPEHLQSYFKFAFVRNPYTRVLSVWKMFRSGTTDIINKRMLWEPRSELKLEDVLDITEDDSILYDQRRRKFEEIVRHHSLPITHPFNDLLQADYIGKVESIDEDWREISNRIGLPFCPLPIRHRSFGEESIKSLTSIQKDRIRKIYNDDFEILGYDK